MAFCYYELQAGIIINIGTGCNPPRQVSGMRVLWRLWNWLKMLQEDVLLLYYAWRHPQTPPYIKGLLAALAAYIISPVDFLPDYLPLVGIVDEAVLIPTAVWYLTNILPAPVRAECYHKSYKWRQRLPILAGLLIILLLVWLGLIVAGINYLLQ